MSDKIAERLRVLADFIERGIVRADLFAVVTVHGDSTSVHGDLLKMRDEKLLYRAADILDSTP